jgi:excisionase family DNA binding protein
MKIYWNVKELAEYSSIDEKTLYEWVRLRKIPFHRINGCIRFHIEQSKRFIDSKEVKPRRIVA